MAPTKRGGTPRWLHGLLANRGRSFNVTVVSAQTDPAMSIALPPAVEAGVPAAITIVLRDQFGNRRRGGSGFDPLRPWLGPDIASAALVRLDVPGGAGAVSVTTLNRGDGTLTASFTPTTTGRFQCDMSLQLGAGAGWAALAGSGSSLHQLGVRPGPTSAAHCLVGLSAAPVPAAAATLTAGELAQFSVQARDRFGNIRDANSDVFAVALCLSSDVNGVAVGSNAGPSACVGDAAVARHPTLPATGPQRLYWLQYTPTWAGGYTVALTLGGQQLAGVSAFHTFVRAAAVDAVATCSSGAGLTEGIAGRVNRYTIHARDRFGNSAAGAGSQFRVAVVDANSSAPAVTTLLSVGDSSDGNYAVRYVITRAARYLQTVFANDRQTHRHTDRHTERHTDRHTDTQTHRHTDRHTDTHTDT
jgi:hypothetical protein